ncbi:MAG TPA: SagB family peptide dehydrogenase [Vicinamibacterales bacterium]|nr:SagB family peptide dehydrogenase [Vicinamibacterales bacterium]
MATRRLYRRSPHVVCYWKHGEFVFHNYATRRLAGASALACDVLDFFSDWRSVADLAADKPDVSRPLLRTLVSTLLDLTLLQASDRPPGDAERAMDRFSRWNPEAGFFHTATKDVEFTTADAAARTLLEQSRDWPMPPPVKRYDGARSVSLAPPAADDRITEILLSRRTWRRFGEGTIPLATLGTLLGLTAGVQQWVAVPGHGEVALKTSPSGGARHPVELYVLAWKIDGLAAGLYHYAPDRHALEVVNPRVGGERVPAYLPQSEYFADACALVLFSAVYERDLWRYGYSRAYRAPLVEAGHLCQTFCLLATAHRLAPFSIMGLADSEIEKDLGVDGVTESVLYAAGVGVLPAGAEWAPAPPGVETPAVRVNASLRREDG